MTTKEKICKFHEGNIRCYRHQLAFIPKKKYTFKIFKWEFTLLMKDRDRIKKLHNNIKQAEISLSNLDIVFGKREKIK